MRVKIYPGTYREVEVELSDAVQADDYCMDPDHARDVMRYAREVSARYGALVDLLVERGVLSLSDMPALDAPTMDPVE